eukprot:m.158490 g.158490  ORF g.158490 m.158490 type:complete len:115 (+) comp17602_c0_seq1:1967-2311(+)
MEELTEIKDDAQQRSWSSHDDFDGIKDLLNHFLSLIQDGNPTVLTKLVQTFCSVGQHGCYEFVETLVLYYQMETRAELRALILKVLDALGEADQEVFSVLQLALGYESCLWLWV